MSIRPEVVVDAKGDLLVGRDDNYVSRLGVGADGEVLTADSTAQEGVAWGGTLFTLTDASKLDGIEALADVTDAENVEAAGAAMLADISAGSASTGAVATTAFATVTVTLDRAMLDDTYRVVASVVEATAGAGLVVSRIRSRTTTEVVVEVQNNALASRTGEVHVMAFGA